jgi:endonuclease G
MNMRQQLLFILGLIAIHTIAIAQQQTATTPSGRTVILYDNFTWQYQDSIVKAPHANWSTTPKSNTGQCDVISHTGFSLCYNEQHEQAEWVSYMLCKARLNRVAERTNRFITDPKVKTGSAENADYSGSGYDRGHLAPAADMAYSEATMRESFYFSNMSPQVPSFNRGVWKKLEEQVREWAMMYDTIWIATGPILMNGLPTIGANKVSVPELYYKAILVHNKQHTQAIAIVMPNQSSTRNIQSFVITVDSLQKLTAIDFFSELDDRIESRVEQRVNHSFWFGNSLDNAPQRSRESSTTAPASVKDNETKAPASQSTQQCMGTAKSTGVRCKNKTSNSNGYCHVHQSQAR